jgi:hypothetical protein
MMSDVMLRISMADLLDLFAQLPSARGLDPMEIVVAVMRKLLHFAFGVLKSGQPFDAQGVCLSSATP